MNIATRTLGGESVADVGRIARGREWINTETGRRRAHTAAGRVKGSAGSAGSLNCARRSESRVQPQSWGRIESEDDAIEGRREARRKLQLGSMRAGTCHVFLPEACLRETTLFSSTQLGRNAGHRVIWHQAMQTRTGPDSYDTSLRRQGTLS